MARAELNARTGEALCNAVMTGATATTAKQILSLGGLWSFIFLLGRGVMIALSTLAKIPVQHSFSCFAGIGWPTITTIIVKNERQ